MSVAALTNQSALITGGGSGIGLACAAILARDGATVTIAGRSKERLDKALAELPADLARAIACDVAEEADVKAAVDAAFTNGGGRLDICVAAAGTGAAAPSSSPNGRTGTGSWPPTSPASS